MLLVLKIMEKHSKYASKEKALDKVDRLILGRVASFIFKYCVYRRPQLY